jgi:hypothetical protein
LIDELLESGLFQIGYFHLAIDNGHFPGGQVNEAIQQRAPVEKGYPISTQLNFFREI